MFKAIKSLFSKEAPAPAPEAPAAKGKGGLVDKIAPVQSQPVAPVTQPKTVPVPVTVTAQPAKAAVPAPTVMKAVAPPTPVEEVPAPAAKTKPAPPAPAKKAAEPVAAPEVLCGIAPKMTKEEIRAHLALLYRRYNRATSSLDGKLRIEAEKMLDAIVAVREKTFGPI